MKKINIYALLALILSSLGVSAQQVTLITPDMTVPPDENLQLALQVEDFDLITGCQFSINWDASVVQYIGVDNFGLPDMTTEGNFGTTGVDTGTLRFAWYQQSLEGVTLADLSAIFSIRFKAIGDPGQSTLVSITNEPIVIEVVNTSGIVPVTEENGTVTIAGASASMETHTTDFVLYQNSPNPFHEVTYVPFDLKSAGEAQLSIHDQSGKVVFEKTGTYAGGSHVVPVRGDLFQSAGSYFFTLKTGASSATRQLVFQ